MFLIFQSIRNSVGVLLQIVPTLFVHFLSLVECKTDGYLTKQYILLDSRRVTPLCIKNKIQYQKLDISLNANSNPSEIIAVELNLKENIIHACVYRSSSLAPDNSNDMNKSLEILSRRFNSNLLDVGDFNYPRID